jgi:hypothetical protein
MALKFLGLFKLFTRPDRLRKRKFRFMNRSEGKHLVMNGVANEMRLSLHLPIILSVVVMVLVVSSSFSILHESAGTVIPRNSGGFMPSTTQDKNGFSEQTSKHLENFTAINPYLYTEEPAPMGIADYGIGPNGIPYETNRTSYTGTVNISGISTFNSSWPGDSMGFQLNLNLVFINSGNRYVFWVQDVALLNTTSREIQFLDNIWNSSQPQSGILNSSVTGNGTVGDSSGIGFYYFVPGNDPGNLVELSYPTTVTLRMNTSLDASGSPQVNFSYNDGYGWVTYDKVVFTFANNVRNVPEFQVSGFSYKPDNLPMNAEFIMGGPGGGSDTKDMASRVSMMLDYWNGYNYQAVSNAYDFGSNTAEGVSNVSIALSPASESGTPGISAESGSGALGMAYNTSTTGFLNLSSPNLPSGQLYINTTVVPYENQGANVTLYSGKYDVHLVSGSQKMSFGTVTILPDSVTRITTVSSYWVNFTESGLPPGSYWAINMSGILKSSTGNTISLLLHNGTYFYNVSTIPGYSAISNSGKLSISGAPVNIKVKFTQIKYVLNVFQSGLPAGTLWYLNISSTEYNFSESDSLIIQLPNGTYHYSYSTPDSIYSGGSGSFRVYGSNITITVDFMKNGELVVISGINSTLFLNGEKILDDKSNFSIYLKPGTYYLVDSAPGYYAYSDFFSIRYSSALTLNITLKAMVDYGYLNGTVNSNNAIIRANGMPVAVSSGKFNETLPAGRYVVSIYGDNLTPEIYSLIIYGGKETYLNITTQSSVTFDIQGRIMPGNAEILFNGLPATTNSSGYYVIYLPAGQYKASVTESEYMPESYNLSVSGNISRNFALDLIPARYALSTYGIVTVESANISLIMVNNTAGSVSISYSSDTSEGTMLIYVPLNNLTGSSVSQALSSRVYINGYAISNYTIAITGNYTAILSVNIHNGDPLIIWLLNSSLQAPLRHLNNASKLISPQDAGAYLALGALVAVLLGAVALTRKRFL